MAMTATELAPHPQEVLVNGMEALNVLSLFSGIGGLDLGLQRAGMRIVGHVEIDPYCRRVLAKHWPEVPQHDDVRTAPEWWAARQARPHVDVVAGGFPCQPVSFAGRDRLGPKDPRWLWPAMRGFVAGLRPEWVLFENVPGLRARGLRLVVDDLEGLGYRVRVGEISACSVGASHVRRRLFGVAHASGPARSTQGIADPGTCPAPPRVRAPESRGQDRSGQLRAWASESPVCRGTHGVPARVDRMRALGNAVVPAVGEYMGRLVLDAAQFADGARARPRGDDGGDT